MTSENKMRNAPVIPYRSFRNLKFNPSPEVPWLKNMHGEITATIEEAYKGTARVFEVNREKIRIQLKPGAYDGLVIRLAGK